MKRLLGCAGALLALASMGCAQSPSATESKTIDGKTISIEYSSPRVNGREGKLFGKSGRIGQDPDYPVWRAGANEATKLHTDANLKIGTLEVPKGDYSLYVELSSATSWNLVINKQTGQSGMEYNKAKDLGRTPMTVSKPPSMVENLKYTLSEEGKGQAKLTLAWENQMASVPIMVQ